jgi:hypothetical protein
MEPSSKRKYTRKTTTTVENRKCTPKKTKSVKFSKVVQILENQRPRIVVKRNLYGQYEHEETGFIFDSNTEQVVGKHVGNGKIEQLTEHDQQLAKTNYNFTLNKS